MQNCQSNQMIPINTQTKQQINRKLENMAGRGLRTVSVAYKEVNKRDFLNQSKVNRGKEK